MRYFFIICLGLITLPFAQAQDEDQTPKERREEAFMAIKDLKEDGCIVVRLKTKHRKIKILKQNVRGLEGKPKRQRRYQEILDGTIERRDAINAAMIQGFNDSFSVCPIYFIHDTASRQLLSGKREGIFVDAQQQADPSIRISEKHIFMVDFRPQSGTYPFDVLVMRRLEGKLDDPFPYLAQIRESLVSNINSSRIERAAQQWATRLERFYQRKLERIEELEEKDE